MVKFEGKSELLKIFFFGGNIFQILSVPSPDPVAISYPQGDWAI